ncbi:MAG: O-antigen ligase family protein [Pyrinomonadaceae bacterium]
MDSLKRVAQAWLVGTFLTILASLAGFVLFYFGWKTQYDNYFLSHFGSLPTGNYPRIHALFANANMMCNFLNVSLMLAVLADKLGWLKKIWAKVLCFGIGFAAFFTLSPGLGGLFLSIGVWLWANFNFARRKTFAGIVCFLGIFLALIFFAVSSVSPDTPNTDQDFKLPFFEQKFEPSVRVLIWQDSLESIRQYPFFGKGIGIGVASVEYTTLSGDRQFLSDAHLVWLNIFGQLGLFGFVAFASLCLFLLWRCKFYLADDTEKSFAQLALFCAFIGAFWYQGLTGSFENARHLWILFGLLASFGENSFGEKT